MWAELTQLATDWWFTEEEPPDPPQAIALEVKLERSLSGLVIIAERVRTRRVLAAARPALEAPAAGAVKARLHLSLRGVAIRTLMHVMPYTVISSALGNPFTCRISLARLSASQTSVA